MTLSKKEFKTWLVYSRVRSKEYAHVLNMFCEDCHVRSVAAGWFTNLKTGKRNKRNLGEMIALIHSELSECLEGIRKDLMDTHLPKRKMAEVEIADAFIRLGDLAGYLVERGYFKDPGGATVEKLEYNLSRKDHSLAARKKGGKRF